MADVQNKPQCHPGDDLDPIQILALAVEYGLVSASLSKLAKKNQLLSSAPFRFAALHSIELFFNAFLRHKGLSAIEIRLHHHDLAWRIQTAKELGLLLRPKHEICLVKLSGQKAYVAMRYDHFSFADQPAPTMLHAIIGDLAQMVHSAIGPMPKKAAGKSGK